MAGRVKLKNPDEEHLVSHEKRKNNLSLHLETSSKKQQEKAVT